MDVRKCRMTGLRSKFGSEAKIIHLTTVHSPRDVRIFLKECRTLALAGYEVVLIARGNKTEVVEGVKIVGSGLSRCRGDRMTRGLLRTFLLAYREQGRIYHFHDPELIPVGLLLKLAGKKVVYDVHEDFAASLRESDREWLPPLLKWLTSYLIRLVEKVGVAVYDAAVVATPKISSLFPSAKTVLVQNYPLLGELQSEKPLPYAQRPFNVIYAGGISERRGIREMISAIHALRHNGKTRLLLAGEFSPPELGEDIKNMPGWEQVEYLGLLSRGELAASLGRSRIGIALLHPIESYIYSQPIKLFEYMSAGIPVVVSNFPLWKDIVEKTGAGMVVDPLDETAVSSAVKWLFDHEQEAERMGKNGALAVQHEMNWGTEAKKLLDLYKGLLDK